MDIKLGIKKIKEENNIKGKEIDLNQNKKFETEYLTRDEFIKKQKKKKKKFKPSTLLIPIEEKNSKNDDSNNNYFQNIYINEDEMERLEKIEKLKNKKIINENIVFKALKENENNNENNNNENTLLNFDNIPLFIPRKNKKTENKKESKDIKNLRNNNENKIKDNNNKNNNLSKEKNLKENEKNNIKENDSNINELFNDDLGELEEIPTRKGVSLALYIFKQKKLITEDETFGRYNDKDYKKDINNNNNNNNKEKKIFDIEIEYRDEEGKKLKPKEMARYQSYIFHGENAGIRKREKKILRDLKQKRVTNQLNTKTMKLMKNKQNKTNNPFITIQEKNSHFL